MGGGLTAAESHTGVAREAERIARHLAEQHPHPEARRLYRQLVERVDADRGGHS